MGQSYVSLPNRIVPKPSDELVPSVQLEAHHSEICYVQERFQLKNTQSGTEDSGPGDQHVPHVPPCALHLLLG